MAPSRDDGQRWRLTALALATLLPSLGTSIANVALPTLTTAFAAPFEAVQWVVVAYLLAVTALIVVAGRLGDMLGRRRLLLAGVATFALASALCAMAGSLWVLVAARALQGAGAAVMMALSVASVGDMIPKDRIGRAVGLLGTVSAVGTALGPSLGGLLISTLGWHAIFVTLAVAGCATLVFDWRVLPVESATGHPAPSLLAGLHLLRQWPLVVGLASMGLVSAIVMATLVVGPFYLSQVLGLGPAATGLVMTIGPAVAAISGIPAGRFVDRFGATPMMIAGLIGVTAGSLLMTVLPQMLGVGGYAGGLSIVTAGYALFLAANTTGVMTGATGEVRGVVSALLGLARNLGLIGGASAMGAVFAFGSRGIATLGLPAGGSTGLQLTFAVAAFLAGLALAFVAAARRPVRS